MFDERTSEDELAELMADHILSDIDRDKGVAIVDGDRVLDEIREDGRTSRPSLDDFLLAGFVLLLNSLQEFGIAIRSLLGTSGHLSFSS